MDKYETIKSFFTRTLTLINYIDDQCSTLEEKINIIKKASDERMYQDLLKILSATRAKNKSLKDRLSALACELTTNDEAITDILDEVYLNQHNLKFHLFDINKIQSAHIETFAKQ